MFEVLLFRVEQLEDVAGWLSQVFNNPLLLSYMVNASRSSFHYQSLLVCCAHPGCRQRILVRNSTFCVHHHRA